MRRLLVLPLVAAILAGCSLSASSSPPTPTPLSMGSYRDAHYHFSFRYPAIWTVPAAGRHTTLNGVATYLLNVKTPGNAAGIQITVDHDLANYSSIPEGDVVPYGADTLHYHHLTVGGWPAIQIDRYNGKQLDDISTIVNTRTYSYQVQMLTGTPPFSSSALSGYHTVVQSMKIPF